MKVVLLALLQNAWLALREIGRCIFGAERFDGWIDRTGLRELKNRTWLSRRETSDGNVILHRPQDQCIVQEIYDQDIYGAAEILPGQTVVDAGAHIGVFCMMAARRVGPRGRIIAFEPSPASYRLLQRNVGENRLAWVKIHNTGLAEIDGNAAFFIAAEGKNNPVADTLTPAADRVQVDVRLRRLDDVLSEEGITRVDHLKIDVEGAELRLLDGAPKTLSNTEHIVMEVHPPAVEPAEVVSRLEALGFSCRLSRKNGCVVLKASRLGPKR